ncbi:MAG: hypothetical protein K1X82_03550 [Bacteroidia bacterium]|nr:hypothetical protein [Bacteroidia bacterium]
MKKLVLGSFLMLSLTIQVNAQINTSGNVGVGTTTPQVDAVLEVTATDRGMLVPRLATTAINAIFSTFGQCSPGLLVYNTDVNQFWYNSSSSLSSPPVWVQFPILACPTNFVAVNQSYCILNNEQTADTWFNAVQNCGTFGVNGTPAHLCTWAEWYNACPSAGTLLISNMTGNSEWVDDATGASNAKVVGTTNCQSSGEAAVTTQNTYRCCFNR